MRPLLFVVLILGLCSCGETQSTASGSTASADSTHSNSNTGSESSGESTNPDGSSEETNDNSDNSESSAAVCEANTKYCIDETTAQVCRGDGSEWVTIECPETQTCLDGVCLMPECFPGVMFLVDRSTSMHSHWNSVGASIQTVVNLHPGVRFGLSAFPASEDFFGSCSSGDGWPHVEIQSQSNTVLADWFNNHGVSGATPLVNAMEWMSENAASIWGGEEVGSLIVLSDGQDKCDCSFYDDDDVARSECAAEDLAEATASLRQQNVNTYVIGYNYSGNTLELEAIASNGGTAFSSPVFAGGEAQLANVFDELVRDIKLCH